MVKKQVSENLTGRQVGTTVTPVKVSIVDVSDAVKVTAVDRAEEKLTAEASELKGVKGFFRKVWKFNVGREYYRQKEIVAAKKEILANDDLYGDKVASQEAKAATVERFMSDCDEAIHKDAGETKEKGKDEIREAVKKLVSDYAGGSITDDEFKESRARIFSAVKGTNKDGLGLMYADNMLEVAKQIKDQISHGESMDELLRDFQVEVGRAKMGVRTEAQFNAVDRLTSRIMNTRVGCWIGETTVASAMSIVYCVGQRVIETWSRSAAAKVGSFGATALVSGAVAGAKEGYRIEEERKKHFRDMAKGKSFDDVRDKRRKEMDRFRYETRRAGDLTEELRQGMGDLDADKNIDNARVLIGVLAETEARVRLSDQKKIDLLSYSDEKKVEQERFELDETRAAAKVMLKILTQKDGLKDVLGGKNWDDFLVDVVGTKMEEMRNGEIDPKNRLFNKMKTKRVAGAVAKGVISGVVIGGVAQEVRAFFDPNQQGLVETFVKGQNATVTGAEHLTPLESLRSYISGDWKKAIGFREEVVNGVRFRVPEGMDLVRENGGAMVLIDGKGNRLIDGLEFDGKGGLTDESIRLLESKGGIVSGINREISRQVEEVTQRNVGVGEFVGRRPDLFQGIRRTVWYDNDTSVFDKGELKLGWGGVGSTGIDGNGNYVLDVSRMVTGDSYNGGLSADAMELARQGKLFLALSASEGTQTQVAKILFDASGKAVIDRDSEIAKILFDTSGGSARFLGKFAEVAQSIGTDVDGAEQVRVLATAVGKGLSGELPVVDKVAGLIKETVTEWVVSAPAPEQTLGLVDMPPIIPITWRTPLERIRDVPPVVAPGSVVSGPTQIGPTPPETVVPPVIPGLAASGPIAAPESVTPPTRPLGSPAAPESVKHPTRPLASPAAPESVVAPGNRRVPTRPLVPGAPETVVGQTVVTRLLSGDEGAGGAKQEAVNPYTEVARPKEIPPEDMIGKDDKEFLVVKSDSGGVEDKYKIADIVRGGQSSIVRGRIMQPDGALGEKDLALRYGNGSAEIDELYRDIYLRAPVEVQKCMPRSYGVVKGRSGVSYAVQEWVDGRGLRNELEEKTVLPPEDAKVILEELGRVLTHLHAKEGYLHRDIKPDNIIIHRDSSGKIDRVVLTDWDLIKEVRSQPKSEGTPGYAPWQQHYPAESLWPVIDEHALGMTLLEIMTGQEVAGETINPFRAPVEDYLNSANLPPVWNEIILGLTSVDQEKRLNARKALELLDKA